MRVLSLGGAVALVFSLLLVPAATAHDDVSGPADLIITIGGGLSDRDARASVGDIVRFVNRDGERHRMRSRSGPVEFDTGNLEPGESHQVRLSVAGTYGFIDERDRDAVAYHGRIVVTGASGGSGGGDGAGGATGGGGVGGGAAGGGTVAAAATVTIGDRVFQPASVTVAVGGTVSFQNQDGDEHTATSTGAGGIDSGTLGSGATYRKRFTAAGTFEFLCLFHSDMRGTVRVVAGAGAAPAAPKPTTAPAPTPVPIPSADPSARPAPTAVTGPAPTEVSVDAADFAFRPATIEVATGGQVTWTNRGAAPHSVTAGDGGFDSGMLDAGTSFQHRFGTPGTYAYVCAFHPEMQAAVRVVAATTGSAGTSGPAAAAAPSAEPAPAAAAQTGQPAPAAAAQTGEPPPAAAATTAASTTATSSGPGGLAGIVLAVTFVSIAVALFAAAIRGTSRTAG